MCKVGGKTGYQISKTVHFIGAPPKTPVFREIFPPVTPSRGFTPVHCWGLGPKPLSCLFFKILDPLLQQKGVKAHPTEYTVLSSLYEK